MSASGPHNSIRRFILTGAPGTGKTTVLDAIDPSVRVVSEPARDVLAELRSRGESTDLPPDQFVARLLRRSIESFSRAAAEPGPVVFDRGIPDCAAYAIYFGIDAGPSLDAAAQYRYHDPVLLLDPWEEIYATDAERTMTFDMVLHFHEAVVEAYRQTGYTFNRVPRTTIARRAAFIDRSIAG